MGVQTENSEDMLEALRAFGEGLRNSMWSALPCIVESFNPAEMTVSAQPTVQARVRSTDDRAEPYAFVTLPLLIHVPVVFPTGGGLSLTFPITKGDEVLVVFASRAIDLWWLQGGVQQPNEIRSFDLSDGFAIPGPRSRPRVIPALSSGAELRLDTGAAHIRLSPSGAIDLSTGAAHLTLGVDGSCTIKAPAGISLTGVLRVLGSISATGPITPNTP